MCFRRVRSFDSELSGVFLDFPAFGRFLWVLWVLFDPWRRLPPFHSRRVLPLGILAPSVGSTRPPIRRTSEHHTLRSDWFGSTEAGIACPPHDRISAERRGSRDAWSPLTATRRRTESGDRTSSSPPFDSDADPANRLDQFGSAPSRARHEKVEGSPARPIRASPALEVEAFLAPTLRYQD